MKKIRIGNDITVLWHIRFASDNLTLESSSPRLFLHIHSIENCSESNQEITNFGIEGEYLQWIFRGKEQTQTGIYTLTLVGNDGADNMFTIDACEAFQLVPCTCLQTEGMTENGSVETIVTKIESLVEAVSGAGGIVINNTGMGISGTVNLAKSEGKTKLQNAYNSLKSGEMAYYLVTDSNGLLPSPNQTYVTIEDSVRALFTTDSSLGVSVGDIVVVAKLKVLVTDVPVYRILPLNDAKAASGNFPGAMGLESPWDKKQINLVPTALQFPTKEGSNMNNCLESGIYPWCTLGRPAGSIGAYTLAVKKSTSADSSGYYTIEQTAYGRQDELGQIWKRIIFYKENGSDTQYGEWVQITGNTGEFEKRIYNCPGSFTDITNNSTPSQVEAILGEYDAFLKVVNNRSILIDSNGIIAYSQYVGGGHFVFWYSDFYSICTTDVSMGSETYGEVVVSTYSHSPINALNDSSTNAALSANQGRILNEKLKAITVNDTKLSALIGRTDVTKEELEATGLTDEKLKILDSGIVPDILIDIPNSSGYNVYRIISFLYYNRIRSLVFEWAYQGDDTYMCYEITNTSGTLYSVVLKEK